jgi:spermidine/putrescine transport system substrate-binding protein
MVAAACGARPPRTASSGTTEEIPARTQPDQSATDAKLNWSTWVGYMDVDEEGNRPTLDRFMEQTGIAVDYREDVNDNAEFDAKVRPQLEAGQDIGRDIVVLTDWMAAQWIRKGYAQKFDRAWVPNARNLIDKLANVPFDPERDQSLPWQSGYAGLGFNTETLKELTGKSEIRTIAELWDPALKGRVTILSEMRDSVGVVMLAQGNNPADFTEDDYNAAIAELQKQMDAGQIRQVSGNDYIAALETGDVVAAIGWSGDVAALGEPYKFVIPESGGTLWTDNMLVPAMARHRNNAERLMDYYYDPAVSAELAAWVQYICPVKGAQEEMQKIDPSLVENPFIFPTDKDLENVTVFKTLTSSEQVKYDQAFQTLIGN